MADKPQLTSDEWRTFKIYIRMMQTSISELRGVLPDKEGQLGSTLQQIDSLVSKLIWEYTPDESGLYDE